MGFDPFVVCVSQEYILSIAKSTDTTASARITYSFVSIAAIALNNLSATSDSSVAVEISDPFCALLHSYTGT